jgi:choline kinase
LIAVLLSAGKGTRMYPLTANTPKCLIDIGKGKTILESQLDVLQECGISKVYIVAGYRIEQVQAKINGHNLNGMEVEVLHNPFYATSNNIISLWLATLVIEEPFISINGDDIFKPNVINSLLEAKGDIVMTIDRKAEYDADDMMVMTTGDRVVEVSKELDRDFANGESVGIVKYSVLGQKILKNTIDTMLQNQDNHQHFYLLALQQIMDGGVPINFCEVDEDEWAEIDFHPDVTEVRNKVDHFVQQIKL